MDSIESILNIVMNNCLKLSYVIIDKDIIEWIYFLFELAIMMKSLCELTIHLIFDRKSKKIFSAQN